MNERSILLWLLAVAAGLWIFLAIASEVKDGDSNSFDRRILLSMRSPGDLAPLGPPAFVEAVRDVTALGSTVVLGLLTLATATFLALDGKPGRAGFLIASITLGDSLSTLLKDIFNRPRPEIVPHAAYASNSSFPSGHSMTAALTYFTLAALLAGYHERRRIKAFLLLTAALLVLLIGLSRVYLGVHWPTDVLAGWTAGTLWALLTWMATEWYLRPARRKIPAAHSG